MNQIDYDARMRALTRERLQAYVEARCDAVARFVLQNQATAADLETALRRHRDGAELGPYLERVLQRLADSFSYYFGRPLFENAIGWRPPVHERIDTAGAPTLAPHASGAKAADDPAIVAPLQPLGDTPAVSDAPQTPEPLCRTRGHCWRTVSPANAKTLPLPMRPRPRDKGGCEDADVPKETCCDRGRAVVAEYGRA